MTRGPFEVGVSELTRRVGVQRPFQRSLQLDDLGMSNCEVIDELEIDLVLESIPGDVITATGSVATRWRGACRRCLDDVEGDLALDIRERFESSPRDDESYPIDGDDLDLEPLVREAVLLALPLAPLCGDDCRGPAPEVHPAQPPDEDGEAKPDPRWAALDQLRFDD